MRLYKQMIATALTAVLILTTAYVPGTVANAECNCANCHGNCQCQYGGNCADPNCFCTGNTNNDNNNNNQDQNNNQDNNQNNNNQQNDNYTYIKASSCTEKGIQNALNTAKDNASDKKPYYVSVPKGSFKMLYGLHIYSNTTLDLTGVKITNPCKRPGAILQVGYPRREGGKNGYKKGGYSRGRNIKVIGGTLNGGKKAGIVSSIVTFSHVKNITFDGVTFTFKPTKTDDAHLIEFGGSKDVVITNCKFYGTKKVCEALQLESTIKNVAHSDLMGKEDGTVTKNVEISNCVFDNFEYALGCNHGCKKDLYKNIVIKNNTFKNIKKYCICTYNFQATITGNTAKKCPNKTRIFKLGKKNKIKAKNNKW